MKNKHIHSERIFNSSTNVFELYIGLERDKGKTDTTIFKELCDHTNRKHNFSYHTRWIENKPPKDVVDWIQRYLSSTIVRREFPNATDQQINNILRFLLP